MTKCVTAAPMATAAILSERAIRPAMAMSQSIRSGTVTFDRMLGNASTQTFRVKVVCR